MLQPQEGGFAYPVVLEQVHYEGWGAVLLTIGREASSVQGARDLGD